MNNIGTSKTQTDQMDPARAAALHAVFDLENPAPQMGDAVPPFWHYAYFWDALSPNELGRDGHPKTGSFIPDLGLPRRMWAGGDLQFHAPLRLGIPATKRSVIADVSEKSARSGPLAIVTLNHEISQNGTLCVSEKQSLIYRQDADPDAAPPEPPIAPTDETTSLSRNFSPIDLFRYSALTFNGHRIHYDRDYAKSIEGYAGLIVHGPILAQMLVHLAQDMLGNLTSFTFRATAPMFDFETGHFCAKPDGDGAKLWVRAPDGRMCLTANAR